MYTAKPGSWCKILSAAVNGLLLISLFIPTQPLHADPSLPNLGRNLGPDELAALDTHVFADGSGLPAGGGDGKQGQLIFRSKCAACHGSTGQGASALELVGDRSLLATEYPDRGIAVYWPFAPTLFEYIQRAMPPDKPYSLNNDEVYALIAWLLEINQLIETGQRVDARLLATLKMPNRNGFRSGYVNPE